jgi:TATA-box binding protein (TBP) (component of TFIID and TFIIIB)
MDNEAKGYRISTITATASLNTEINLDLLYQSLKPLCTVHDAALEDGVMNGLVESNESNACEEGIVYIEYGKKKVETIYKGYSKKIAQKQKADGTAATKRFDNQVTIVYRMIANGVKCMMNTKIFKNGNVQMTGIRGIEQGREMVEKIARMIKSIYESNQCIGSPIVANIDQLGCKNYKLRLINSDFRVGYDIKREQLYKILMDDYNTTCSFEPCIYPAVKIKYYFNDCNAHKDGVCYCSKRCIIGKGCGSGDKQCKKVTIAVFQSGCIIITGGQSIEQVDEAYAFIRRVLSDNIEHVRKKKVIVSGSEGIEENFKVLVKTANIKHVKNIPSF